MKYAVDVGSSAIMHIPNSMKTGSDIQKLMGGGGGPTSQLYEWRLKMTRINIFELFHKHFQLYFRNFSAPDLLDMNLCISLNKIKSSRTATFNNFF
jgi:hypothetical protein